MSVGTHLTAQRDCILPVVDSPMPQEYNASAASLLPLHCGGTLFIQLDCFLALCDEHPVDAQVECDMRPECTLSLSVKVTLLRGVTLCGLRPHVSLGVRMPSPIVL